MTVVTDRREGFWCSAAEPNLPNPQHLSGAWDWPGKFEFLEKLTQVQNNRETRFITYRGFSTCRICFKANGSKEFCYQGWYWPEGYEHYIREHNIRPSLAFQELIMDKRIK